MVLWHEGRPSWVRTASWGGRPMQGLTQPPRASVKDLCVLFRRQSNGPIGSLCQLIIWPSSCSLEDPACWTDWCSVFLMSDGLVPPLCGADIWLILQVPIWPVEHKHLLGFWWACGRLQSGEAQGKVRKGGGELREGKPRAAFLG